MKKHDIVDQKWCFL